MDNDDSKQPKAQKAKLNKETEVEESTKQAKV